MKTKIIFSILTALVLFFNSEIYAQDKEFLSEVPMDSNLISDGLRSLIPKLDSINLVFTGENHRFYSVNQYTKFKLMRFLHKFGFRYLTVEFGSGIGYLANDYVFNGNETAAKILTENFKNKRSAFVDMLGMLKRFNESLSNPRDKIRIEGIDFARYPFYSTRALALIIEKAECEDDLKDYYEDLNVISTGNANIDRIGFATVGRAPDFDLRYSFKTYENRIYELSIRHLVDDFYKDTAVFHASLDERYDDFKKILDDLKETVEWYEGDGVTVQSHTRRERRMAEKMLTIFENEASAKVYGQFGRCHIRAESFDQECYGFELESLSKRLEKYQSKQLNILNIPIFYFENGDFKSNRKVTGKRTSKLFKPAKLFLYDSEGDEVIFNKHIIKSDGIVLLNTFSSRAEFDEVLMQDEVKYPSSIGYYSGEGEEFYFSLESQLGVYENTVNDDLGVDELINPHHFFTGLSVKSIDFGGFQVGYRFLMLIPNTESSSNSEFRYTHFRHDFNFGYNFIHSKWFSWYGDLNFILGFAKIRERTFTENNIFTVPVKSEQVSYRNFYYAGAVSTGFRFKIDDFSLHLEASYLRDFSNPEWRTRGTPVPEISRLGFSDFIYSLGIGFRY